MRFSVKEKLSSEEIEAGLKTVIKDGLASQAMVTLTMGGFSRCLCLETGSIEHHNWAFGGHSLLGSTDSDSGHLSYRKGTQSACRYASYYRV